ncbi:MAG: DUF362 domain-containing protein [Dehalococcoidales bacterium]|nr:DUF362 domain-containing protein [Dehalococcoidales bacterium]
MTTIGLVKTTDRINGVKKAIGLLKTNPVNGKAVALKPNFNSADPFPGSTHIDTLRGLILALQAMGAKKITIAERSGPGDSTRRVMEKKGIFDLARELKCEILNMEEMAPDGWVHIHPADSHWPDGFHFPRIYREAECAVQTCCLKTHAYGGHFTLSLKNGVGLVPRLGYPYMHQLHSSPHQREMIAEINTAYSPAIVVLDGVECFTDGGPAQGTIGKPGVIIAGTDRVAIDAVGVAILRATGTNATVSRGPIFQQDQIARAAALGLGVDKPELIKIATGDEESEAYAVTLRQILVSS